MDEARAVIARLDRIADELRLLAIEAEAWARVENDERALAAAADLARNTGFGDLTVDGSLICR